jgi:GNAT superfamily N-acetyltransferase
VGEISGAIFAVDLDLTHPLAYGYDDPRLAVFRDDARVLAPSSNPYENVGLYTARPLLAGYASADNVQRIAGSAAVLAARVGEGTLVRFADDPAFRGTWYGTEKMLLNALFFGPLVKRTEQPGAPGR